MGLFDNEMNSILSPTLIVRVDGVTQESLSAHDGSPPAPAAIVMVIVSANTLGIHNPNHTNNKN